MSAEEMKQQRTQAAHRQRRIIWNNDGFDNARPWAKAETPEGLLEAYTAPLLRSTDQVDSIFYCTSQGFNQFTHNSDVTEVLTRWTANMLNALIAQGTDPLQVMVDNCRQHNIEIFWSLRMNDEQTPGHGKWQQDHPDCLFGTEEDSPPYGQWKQVDYARPEVREQVFNIIQDVCQRYDIDGIELDFFRSMMCFKRLAWGEALGQEEREAMTELLRRVRTMTEEVARERGRPLLIAVRVSDSPEFSRALGLDWEQWLEEDLIDILVVGGYFELRPWEDAVELGHKYDVPVYPCFEPSHMEYPHRGAACMARNCPEGYRARAMNAWNAGADGIYLFNFNYHFAPDDPLWRELGDPEILQPLDKLYHVNVMSTGYSWHSVSRFLGYWPILEICPEGKQFVRVPLLSPEHPVTLPGGEPHMTTLMVGDNVLWGKEQRRYWSSRGVGIVPELKLSLRVEDLLRPQELSVKLNGQVLSYGILRAFEYGWLEYTVDPEIIKQGANSLELTSTKPEAASGIVVQDVQLQVHYRGWAY